MKNFLLFSYDIDIVREARGRIDITPNKERALWVARHFRVDFVHNTVALQGNPLTFTEVNTLLNGAPVAEQELCHIEQVLHLDQALAYVIERVQQENFEFSAATAQTIQGILAPDPTLQRGVFRESAMSLPGSDYKVPAPEELNALFEQGRQFLQEIADPLHRAFVVFMWGSLLHFFCEGNKRTSRFVCNGILMSAGYPPMMVTEKEQLRYHRVMAHFYATQDATQALVWFYGVYEKRVEQFGSPRAPQEKTTRVGLTPIPPKNLSSRKTTPKRTSRHER